MNSGEQNKILFFINVAQTNVIIPSLQPLKEVRISYFISNMIW
uniref:Uncharacterized protein n=1 Tax=Lepeophtheirus salmonis TaxID=72036 RepID=A0A0K2U718_LEPSM